MSRFQDEFGTFAPDPIHIGEIWDHIKEKIRFLKERISYKQKTFIRVSEDYHTLLMLKTELGAYQDMFWFIKTGYLRKRKQGGEG
jgi:hypothetical protein